MNFVDHQAPPTLGLCSCGQSHDHFHPGDLAEVNELPFIWCGPSDHGHWVDFNRYKSAWFAEMAS